MIKKRKIKTISIVIILVIIFTGCSSTSSKQNPFTEEEVLFYFNEATDRNFSVVSKDIISKRPAEIKYVLAADDTPDFTVEVFTGVSKDLLFYSKYIDHNYKEALLNYYSGEEKKLRQAKGCGALTFEFYEGQVDAIVVHKYEDLEKVAQYLYKYREILSSYCMRTKTGNPVWDIKHAINIIAENKEDERSIALFELFSKNHQAESEILENLQTNWKRFYKN